MRKRILQIVPTLDRTGTTKQMSLLACGLPRQQFDVHVCTLGREGPPPGDLAAADVPVTAIGSRWRIDPAACWRLRRHVARLRPELIHTWLTAANLYGYAAARACGVRRLVVSQRSMDPWDRWLALAAERYVARRSDRVVVDCQGVCDMCVRRGLPSEKILVIPPGVATAESSSTTRRQLLDELGLPQGSRLIGSVGRLLRRRRLKDAIWSADLLKVIRDDVHLLIIGDGPHRDRLHRFRDHVRVREKAHFLGVRGDVSRLMAHFDAFWSTGSGQGQPVAIMEAMAAGVPVVAADVPGNRDLVVHDTTGYLAPVHDRAAFAALTEKLLNDASLSQRLGQAARERIQQQFGVERMVDRYVELYRMLLD